MIGVWEVIDNAATVDGDDLAGAVRALGRLEELAIWLAAWQGREPPALARVAYSAADLVTAADTSAEHAQAGADLIEAVHMPRSVVAGQRVTLTTRRDGETRTIPIETARLPRVSGGTGIGVVARTKDVRVVLPFRVSFRSRPDVGGPSAGLAYALALTDMLDRTDDARSRTVAATGTIDAAGSVGAVGAVHEKAIAARDDGADVFVVPAEELSSVDGNGLQVRGVEDLGQAVKLLQAA